MQILLDAVADDPQAALASVGVEGDLWRDAGPAVAQEGDVAPCFPFAKMVDALRRTSPPWPRPCKVTRPCLVRATNGYLNPVANPARLAAQLLDEAAAEHSCCARRRPRPDRAHLGQPQRPLPRRSCPQRHPWRPLVRLNRLAGRNVRAEYYVDDMGKQVGVLAWPWPT